MKALDVQIGGNHYKTMAIQPMEFSLKLDLNAAKHTAIKYASRFESKGGIEDLQKAAHSLELLRDYWLETKAADVRGFRDMADVLQYCRRNQLSSMQSDFIIMVVMACSPKELDSAIESCRDLIAAVECNNYHDIIMPNPVTGNWPASADERIDIIGQNGGEPHYADLNMDNPKNWRVGDLVECTSESIVDFTIRKTYLLTGFTVGRSRIRVAKDDFGNANGLDARLFKWHSRPSAEEIIQDGIVTKAPGDVFIQTEDGETARYSAAGYAASKEQVS